MDERKALGILGIGKKAGKIADGAFLSEKSVKAGRSWLVLVSTDCSQGTYDRFAGMCESRDLPLIRHFDMDTLGHILGKGDRSVISVEDRVFSEKLKGFLAE
ncbi:MAG: ribosomal L7Ae/L30e/S12e/Gadd45 family protein [Lachnospiraceae bacterium]|nr:ribosomal L7Ae/L30e/S12e/Gadd45 family protein [Lachnospiraceae bacterium]